MVCGHVINRVNNCSPVVNISARRCSLTYPHTHTYTLHMHISHQVCHDGVCGECPLSLPRNCPCGKTSKYYSPPLPPTPSYTHPLTHTEHTLPCTEETPRCGSSCDKLLSCGVHRCTRPCHSSKCGVCVQVREARCRCGKHSKTLPCSSTTWLCDSKCQQLRGCGKHHCKRRVTKSIVVLLLITCIMQCCDGQCPPCEQVCNKTLACRNHKCPSPCHQGVCVCVCVVISNVIRPQYDAMTMQA